MLSGRSDVQELFKQLFKHLRCVELVYWKPRRRSSHNREPTNAVVGVTNYDRCRDVYYLIGEVDDKKRVWEVWKKMGREVVMVVETRKGYHFYTAVENANPLKIAHLSVGVGFDRGFCKLPFIRYRFSNSKRSSYLVLRVSPKYREPDLRVLYYDPDYAYPWHTQVLVLLLMLNR
ncbi:MAG: hypothetical protein QXX12_05925 [Nanopusillaceae archaeon]